MITIRRENLPDHDQIRQVTIDAFGQSEFGHNGEADLIESLRNSTTNYLSLVACDAEQIIGHILFTPATIQTDTHKLHGMGLGPMAVIPDRQKTGIGSLLVKEGLKQLFSQDCPFVVVLGHPDFYPRFDFVPALQFGITHGFAGIPQNVFFIQFAANMSMEQFQDGRVYYESAFGSQH